MIIKLFKTKYLRKKFKSFYLNKYPFRIENKMFLMLPNFLRTIFSSGIFKGEENMENGGPQCENYMSYNYRLIVSAIMVFLINF
jgi:hypothetical protein